MKPAEGRRRQDLRSRRGFTAIELLVVTAIIALIVGLALPAIMNARASARQLTCQNNLRNIALAVHMQAENLQRFPAAGLYSATGPEQFHSWVTEILPLIDQEPLYRKYDFNQTWDSAGNKVVVSTSLPILICPDDISQRPGVGNLSYAVNCGFGWTVPLDCPSTLHATGPTTATIAPMDFNGNGVVCPADPASDGNPSDTKLMEALGVFFVENWPPGTGTSRHHRLGVLDDGETQTIMLGENLRAGYDPVTGSGWGSPDIRYVGFLASGYVCENGRCDTGNVDYTRTNQRNTAPYNTEALNASLNQPEGLSPWPSSLHPGKIYFAFCDGRAQSLSEMIDGRVYAALLSPHGSTIKGPMAQQLLSAGDY
ncbi:MAG TPA: DUF1559 domain-containing protein [Planctomycetaceae bacterium]|nr:DUF1559 domain-containing protein [Planctomycetaceae bacterium]